LAAEGFRVIQQWINDYRYRTLEGEIMKYENNGLNSEPVATLDPTDELTLDQQRSLAGAAPLALPEERLDVELPRQGWANSAIPRTVFVGGIIGSVCVVALLFTMLFGGRQKVAKAPPTEVETPAISSDETDKLKTQLALVGQGQDQGIPTPGTRVRTPPAPPKSAAQRTVRSTPPQPQFQPQTRIITTTRSSASTPPAAKEPEPEIDPFEKWDNLASAGVVRGDIPLENVQASAAPPVEPVAEVKIASATLGSGSLPNMGADPQQAQIDLSPGANGILNRRPSTAENNAGQIPIGAVAKAELMIPIIVAGGDITNSAVQLQESLKDEQGHEVLPTGTIFMTKINNVNESSRMIEQTAVGVRYKKNGQFVEEAIPPGLVLIVSRNLEPLQADRIRSRRGFNVASGLAQAIASVSNEVSGGNRGVVSDLLGELASQVRRRSNSDGRVRDQTALSIKAGEKVSVMVNGFLGVTP
jgi:hypothetical protein